MKIFFRKVFTWRRMGTGALILGPVAVSAWAGLDRAEQAAAWLAYQQREYYEALDRYEAAGDEHGKGLTLIALHRPLEAFAKVGDTSGQGLALPGNREPAKTLEFTPPRRNTFP
jgi:hypothetical protein